MSNLCSPRSARRLSWRLLAVFATFLLLVLSAGVTVFMQNAAGGKDHLARRRPATTDVSSPVKVRRDAAPSGSQTIPLNLAPDATIVPPSGCPNVMRDPTFEAGSPWTGWDIQTSSNFGSSMCAAPGCTINGGQTAPYSGRNWLWFGGGTGDLAEVSTQGQTLTIPTGKAAFLRFRMKIQQVLTPFTDTVQVKVDGTSLQTFTEPAVGEIDYTERVVDVSAFANGASHTVVLEYNSTDGNTNFLIDDVFLEVCNSAPSVNQPTTNGIVNSNFETGDPWAPWTHTSTVFGSPMCDAETCSIGTIGGPYSGDNWAWLGGYAAATAGTDIVSQSVTIPAGARAILRFRLRIGQVTSPFTDTFKVKVDGNTLLTITEPTTADATYFERSVNLSQFANGAAHTILFEYVGVGGGSATFNLDDPVLDIAQGGQNFVATLAGVQEVPSNATTGSGVGLVTLNAAENQITVSMSYVGLSSAATLAHIHGSATSTPGNTAPVLFDFGAVNGTAGAFSGLTFAITPAQVALLRNGLLYFNVHTTPFPNGEIRGQIHPTEMSANFDGDGKTDAAVFRPGNTNWYDLRSSDNTFRAIQWGLASDVLTPGDYDGDARADHAVFRSGTWFIRRSSDGGLTSQVWGFGTDIPVPGDYDKDGKTDIAVWRPSDGSWYILKSSNNQLQAQPWGQNGDRPVPGDYDRDGKTDLAVFRPDNPNPGAGTWYILNSSDGSFVQQQFGANTDKLVPADYTGDGKTDIAVWRPSEGAWYISQGSAQNFTRVVWGASTDTPVPGDYDSDAKADLAVFRPSESRWYVLRSLNNTLQVLFFGASTDTPIPSVYVK